MKDLCEDVGVILTIGDDGTLTGSRVGTSTEVREEFFESKEIDGNISDRT